MAGQFHQDVDSVGANTLSEFLIRQADRSNPVVCITPVAGRCRILPRQLGVCIDFNSLSVMVRQQWFQKMTCRVLSEIRRYISHLQAALRFTVVGVRPPFVAARQAKLDIIFPVGLIYLLGAFIGVILGWKLTALAILLSYVLGSIVGAFIAIQKKKFHNVAIPFAPFLVSGTLLAFYFGEDMIAWYLRISGMA